MKKLYTLALTAVFTLSFALSSFAQNANVQVIHNSPDALADSVDVYLNGTLAVDNFAFRTATPYLSLPAGVPQVIGIAPKNSTSYADTLVTFTYTLAANTNYIIVADGVLDMSYSPFQAFNLEVYPMARQSATMMTNTDVLVHHGSTDAPFVDVAETGVGAGTIVNNLGYTDFAGYLELPTNDYVLTIQDSTGGTDVASYQAPLSTLGLDGAAITVVASGFLDPSMNNNGPAFGLFVALEAGGDLVALPAASIGIEEEKALNNISFYPNPVVDEFTVTGLETAVWEYSLMDMAGRVVANGSVENEGKINMAAFGSGVYVLQLESDGLTKSMKIMK